MASKAGLKKVTKTVRGKKGVVRRSYWVKAKDAVKSVGGFLNRNKGKIALGAAAAIGTGLAIHRRLKIDRRQAETRQKTHEEFQKARESIGKAGAARVSAHDAVDRAKAQRAQIHEELNQAESKTREASTSVNRRSRKHKPN